MKRAFVILIMLCLTCSAAMAGSYRKIGGTLYYTDDDGATYPAQIGNTSFIRGEGGAVGTMTETGGTTVITEPTGGVQFGERTGGTTYFRQAAGPEEAAPEILEEPLPEASPYPVAEGSEQEKSEETTEENF